MTIMGCTLITLLKIWKLRFKCVVILWLVTLKATTNNANLEHFEFIIYFELDV